MSQVALLSVVMTRGTEAGRAVPPFANPDQRNATTEASERIRFIGSPAVCLFSILRGIASLNRVFGETHSPQRHREHRVSLRVSLCPLCLCGECLSSNVTR